MKLNRRSKVWINPPGHRIISQQKLSLRQFYNLTNFSKVHLMEAAPLTFLYLSNELVSTFICNSYKYISELQQLHLESRKYSLQLRDKCIWHGGAIWHSCIFQMSCQRHSFAFHSMQSRQSSAHKNSDDHTKQHL